MLKIKEICKPFSQLESVKAIFIYGSAVRTKELKHDIDLLLIIDDSIKAAEEEKEKINELIKIAEEKGKKEKLNLHFQPPRMLSNWWELLRNGEPWAITSLRVCKILYDPSNYVSLMKKLLKKGELYNRDEKAERLLERAHRKIAEIRELLVDKGPSELLAAATEAAQIVLIHKKIFTPIPSEILKKLKQIGLERNFVEFYDDLLELNRKVEKGTLSEFSGKELEKWLSLTRKFIMRMEEMLIELERKEREESMKEAYEECIKLCESALHTKYRKLPKEDALKIELFRKNFVDTGIVDKIHYITLIELYSYQKNKKARKELEKAKYLDKSYIKTFELAINELKK